MGEEDKQEIGRKEAYPTVNVEDTIAVVDPDRVVADKPCRETADEDVEVRKVPCEEEEELDNVKAEEGVPEPARGGSWGLYGGYQ